MKNKFLIFTLCFTIIFSSINYKKTYADGGVISLPLLATISTIAVGTGVVIKGEDDLYDLGRIFYDYVESNNKSMSDILTVFSSSVKVLSSGAISVDTPFLDIAKDFFDNCFSTSSFDPSIKSNLVLNKRKFISYDFLSKGGVYTFPFTSNGVSGKVVLYDADNSSVWYQVSVGDIMYMSGSIYMNPDNSVDNYLKCFYEDGYSYLQVGYITDYSTGAGYGYNKKVKGNIFGSTLDFPYSIGYNWDSVGNRLENDKLVLPVPNDLGNLVGQGSLNWNNTDNLVGTGGISIPNVNAPSIGFDDTISFPNVGDTDVPDVDVPDVDVPGENIWSNVTEYIIGLVVPNDTYWTDTFGGLYNNFTSSFPMVDMDNFNNLVTGEKKFPNIDVNIMGVKGRIVNGDVVNSIVDWLRPIIAGFMMLCLMLFNYRKIYKTIRGVEPFQGIAQGTSDFRTGISEYNYMGTGLSKSDYDANQMELAKALYDYEQDTGKTYKIKI